MSYKPFPLLHEGLIPVQPFLQGVRAGVEFGTLTRDGNCVHLGICRIVADEVAKPSSGNARCKKALAVLHAGPDGALFAFFPASGMLPCTERAIFRLSCLPVPAPYTLDESLAGQLHGLLTPVIARGYYPIGKVPSGYVVRFDQTLHFPTFAP